MLIVTEGDAFRRGAAQQWNRRSDQYPTNTFGVPTSGCVGMRKTNLKGQSVDGLLRRRCSCLFAEWEWTGQAMGVSPQSLELSKIHKRDGQPKQG